MGGKRYGNFVFTNTSDKTCTLSGFPKLALLDRYGKALRGIEIKYENGFVSRDTPEDVEIGAAVTLKPRQTARFQIFYNDGMAMEEKKPFPVVAKVKVSAPNDAREFILESEFRVCCGVRVSSVWSDPPQ